VMGVVGVGVVVMTGAESREAVAGRAGPADAPAPAAGAHHAFEPQGHPSHSRVIF
jgi:hypothetical protein